MSFQTTVDLPDSEYLPDNFDFGYITEDSLTKQMGVKSLSALVARQTSFKQSNTGYSHGDVYNRIVPPPYDPDVLAHFLEVDETHSQAVKTKASDSVLREYTLGTMNLFTTHNDKSLQGTKGVQTKEQEAITQFVLGCNKRNFFEGILKKAAMDYEALGWCGIGVTRSRDGKIKSIYHVPAVRLRVLQDWEAVVELLPNNKIKFYQFMGDKIVVINKNTKEVRPFDPFLDFSAKSDFKSPLSVPNAEWNFISETTGGKVVKLNNGNERDVTFDDAADEIVWITNDHPNTVYYGMSDVVPAIKSIMANVNIRDYFIQFFEHNTVPRYVITVKGGKLSKSVTDAILQYFNSRVKGQHHQTLVIPIPGVGKEIEVEFQKVDSDEKEGSYRGTRKDNSQAIMTAHGVSAAILGISDNANMGSGKGLSQAEIYKDRVISPRQRIWALHINNMFRYGLGIRYLWLLFSPLDIRDREAEARIDSQYLDRGVTTLDEVREKRNLGPPHKEGGSRPFFRGNSVIFVDEFKEMESTPNQKQPDNQEQPNKAPDGSPLAATTDNQVQPPPSSRKLGDNTD